MRSHELSVFDGNNCFINYGVNFRIVELKKKKSFLNPIERRMYIKANQLVEVNVQNSTHN